MDFLKSCETNVRVVEDILQMQYTLYLPTEESTDRTMVSQVVTYLREKGVLCTTVHQELWLFGTLESELKQRLEAGRYNFSIRNEDSIHDASIDAADGRSVQHIFLEAVERSIAYTLASAQDVFHIAPWTWLACSFVKRERPRAHILAKIVPSIAENGTLYFSTTTRPCNIQPVFGPNGDTRKVQTITLAPSGRRARLRTEMMEERGKNQARSVRSAFGHDSWKQRVIDTLRAQSIVVEADESWITVELIDDTRQTRTHWPTRLCFTTNNQSATSDDLRDWKYWFGDAEVTSEVFQHPLAVAEEWYVDTVAQAKAEGLEMNDVGAPGENLQAPISMIPETPLATSSPYNQRTIDQQAAMLGIYPTPPDGLLPAQALNQQSVTDVPNATLQSETSGLSNEFQGLPGSDDTQGMRQSVDSSTGPHTYHAEGDDLFGDIGGMDFGANEIADADFDYFDEPDDIADPPDNIEDDVDMADGADLQEPPKTEATIQKDSLPEIDATGNETHTNPHGDEARPASSHSDMTGVNESELDDQLPILLPPEPNEMPDLAAYEEPKRPLSPFGIRERLLPPPIPASAHYARPLNRRTSTFGPISFNETLNLGVKYGESRLMAMKDTRGSDGIANISLPLKRKNSRHAKQVTHPDSGVEDMIESESSEEDSYESSSDTSMSEEDDLPPRLPWDSKKRKRSFTQDELKASDEAFARSQNEIGIELEEGEDTEEHSSDLLALLSGDIGHVKHSWPGKSNLTSKVLQQTERADEAHDVESIEELLELSKLDLVFVAQVISEQGISTNNTLASSSSHYMPEDVDDKLELVIRDLTESAIDQVFPENDNCTVASLALIKEAPSRQPTNPGKTPQTPYSRFQRENSMQLGPDYFPIPPPFVRIHRGAETWEMLPPALSFWSAMGLGPASAGKDLQTVALAPDNEALIGLTRDFVTELSGMYEMWRLGSVSPMEEFKEMERLEAYDDGVVPVQIDDDSLSFQSAMKAYAETSTELGKTLAKVGHLDPDRTIVVFMINPFEKHARAQQFLCACFWLLYKAYRDYAPKAHKTAPRSDIILQVLPVSLIASPDGLVVLDAQQFGRLAVEIYDRAPPSVKDASSIDMASTLTILAAPAVELASLPPKKIGFQLSADAPTDLLHEGSVLHVAYAVSPDGEWMTICWVDSTGRYQRTSSICMRGRSFKDVATEVWDQTLEVLTARDVTWRLFIVAEESFRLSIVSCWKNLAATKPRRQMLHVTLLSVDTEPILQLTSPSIPDDSPSLGLTSGLGGGFLTPVTTPQGATFTVSPEASGQSTTPLTPAPTEPIIAVAETDPDAHLIDVADESWGMLLSPSFTSQPPIQSDIKLNEPLASGLLFKRGHSDLCTDSHQLDALGVSVHWDIRIRPGGQIDEGPGKQAENTLREVLRMYRNLGLLASVKHLGAEIKDVDRGCVRASHGMPLHIVTAIRGAQALDKLLS